MELLFDILGWTGSFFILGGYACVTLNKSKLVTEIVKYCNLIGGLFIALNCFYYNAIPPFVTNLIWSGIAIVSIFKKEKVTV